MLKKRLVTLVTAVSLAVTSFSGVLAEPSVAEASSGIKIVTITEDDCGVSLDGLEKLFKQWLKENRPDLTSDVKVTGYSNNDGDDIHFYRNLKYIYNENGKYRDSDGNKCDIAFDEEIAIALKVRPSMWHRCDTENPYDYREDLEQEPNYIGKELYYIPEKSDKPYELVLNNDDGVKFRYYVNYTDDKFYVADLSSRYHELFNSVVYPVKLPNVNLSKSEKKGTLVVKNGNVKEAIKLHKILNKKIKCTLKIKAASKASAYDSLVGLKSNMSDVSNIAYRDISNLLKPSLKKKGKYYIAKFTAKTASNYVKECKRSNKLFNDFKASYFPEDEITRNLAYVFELTEIGQEVFKRYCNGERGFKIVGIDSDYLFKLTELQ